MVEVRTFRDPVAELAALRRDFEDLRGTVLARSVGFPPGAIIAWPDDTPPDGALICNWQEIDRSEYGRLFAVRGTAFPFGPGNGSTTFNVPNLVGRTVIGAGGYIESVNLLTADASSFETSTGGWSSSINCTIARITTQAFDGSASLRIRSNAAGNMLAHTGWNYVPAGAAYTAEAWIRAATAVRSCRLILYWYDFAGLPLTSVNGPVITDSTTGWIRATVTGTAPTGAEALLVAVDVASTGAANEDHYVDLAGLFNTADYTFGQQVGMSRVQLTEAQLPAHSHPHTGTHVHAFNNVYYVQGAHDHFAQENRVSEGPNPATGFATQPNIGAANAGAHTLQGKNQPHENLSPAVA